ncbi:hypothetical protein BH10ACT3_BH10ACT3_23170 [soil metagenome]
MWASDGSTVTTTWRGRRAALYCLAALASAAAACSSADATVDPIGDPTSAQVEDSAPSWLASQTADGGRLEFTDGRATRLVLDGVDLHTIMFSDRPDRLADVVDTGAFGDQWDEVFADSSPNAVLVEHRPDGGADSLVVVLSRPVFDNVTRTLSYDIQVLADEQHPESVEGLVGEVYDETPTEFRDVSLFIDNAICVEDGEPACPPPPLTPPPPPPPPAPPAPPR